MRHDEPTGGKPTASRRDASDDQPVVHVNCDDEDCGFDTEATGETRHMAITRATMASATHEHPTTRTVDGDEVDTRVTITGPGADNVHVEGQR